MAIQVEKVDHGAAQMRERLLDYLAPHEAHSLFITGNLKRGFPGTSIYVASSGGQWLGVAGYYDVFKSAALFSENAGAARVLALHVATHHADLEYLNAMAATAQPACDALRPLGCELARDPRTVFMELHGAPPPQPREEMTRLMRPEDHEAVARLSRCLQGAPQDAPVTEDELRKVRINALRHVLVAAGEVVSTASTNGPGLSAFQILGVATAERHRGKGYARAVCAALIRAMNNEGAPHAIIFTGLDNTPARRCYEALGFRVTGEFWVSKLRRVCHER